jgi:DeoR/GlpR family transcriptional regulator of sugar metabolism
MSLMNASERQSEMSAFLAERGYASLGELVERFGVSVSTIRRDLDEMERKGTVRRTHGGAFHVEAREHPLNYGMREAKHVAHKEAIGDLAAAMIHDGDAVLLDGGTTTFDVAKNLCGRRIQVVTNSLPIATLLGKWSDTEVVFLGGSIMAGTGVALGRWGEEMLKSLRVGRAVMGAAGIMEDGMFNANLHMVELERRMIEASDEVIMVVDHSKFGRRSLVRLCQFREIDHLVTDSMVEPRWIDLLRSHGVQVHVANVVEPEDEPGDEPDTESEPSTNGRIQFEAGPREDDRFEERP